MREVTTIPEEWLREVSEEDRRRIEVYLDAEMERDHREDFDEFDDLYCDK